MRINTLPNVDMLGRIDHSRGAAEKTGRLGFGTSHLGGRTGRKESLRLLEIAFDAGIRHFDTAPMYGYGGAEEIVGEFLRDKRDQVTVATKFGIEPPRRSALLSTAKAMAKVAVAAVPALRSKIARRASAMVSSGNFNVPYARMSLRRSLAALGVPCIDVYLMHEVTLEQISSDLLDFLEGAKQRGEIKAYGAALSAGEVHTVLQSQKDFGSVVQIPDGISEDAGKLLRRNTLCITYSIFGERFRTFTRTLAQDKLLSNRCSQQLGFDCTDTVRLGRLVLWNALQRNRGGVVLFSSSNSGSIGRNAALLDQPEFSLAQSEMLESVTPVELRSTSVSRTWEHS